MEMFLRMKRDNASQVCRMYLAANKGSKNGNC